MLEKHCGTFCGIIYRCTDVEVAVDLLRDKHKVIVACDRALSGYMALGFDTFVCCTLNVVPQWITEIYDEMSHHKLYEARACQSKLTRRCKEIRNGDTCGWIDTMKHEFNQINQTIACGDVRMPQCTYKKH